MKKGIIVIAVLLQFIIITKVKGQINLEHTYSSVSAGLAYLDSDEPMFYTMDVTNSKCNIYTLNHTLWKSIPLSLPSNYYLADIQYVTRHLFDSDDQIELLYVGYNYNTTGAYYTYETRIANEDGTLLLTVPGGGYNDVLEVPNLGTRLFLYVYDYSVSPYTVTTKVYSIPGTLPTGMIKSLDEQSGATIGVYPSVFSDKVSVRYTLPAGVINGELLITDISGVTIRKINLLNDEGSINIDLSDIKSGMVLFSLAHGTESRVVTKGIKVK